MSIKNKTNNLNNTNSRNAKRELNDIRFEFTVGKDSAEGIATELVGAGLVDNKDITAITQNLQKLIDSRDSIKVVTFPLVNIIVYSVGLCFVKCVFCRIPH